MNLFAEKLSLRTLISINILIRERNYYCKDVHLQYVYIDRFMTLIAQISPNFNLGSVKEFNFKFDSLIDENGTNLAKKLNEGFEGLEEIYQLIEKKIDLSNLFKLNNDIIWFKSFLKKKITILEPFGNTGVKRLIHILIMIHSVVFYKKKMNCTESFFLMLEKKPWLNELCEYGKNHGIEIIENKFNEIDLYNWIKKNIKINGLVYKIKSFFDFSLNLGNRTDIFSCVVIDQVMQMYRPKWIWASEFLPPEEITFVSKSHPVNRKDLNEIKKEGMNFISLNRKLIRGLDVPIFLSSYSVYVKKNKSEEDLIVSHYANEYLNEKKHWNELFEKVQAKVYLTGHKWSDWPIAAAAAMSEIGGISAVYQTSYYEYPSAYALTHADLYFSFSRKAPMIEKKQGSTINYNICLGNLAQSRNRFFKDEAKKLRKKLKNNGATKIIAYFDHDFGEDKKWDSGISVFRESYQYLLKKVLEEKWLGLIIKPKKPKFIRKSLGDVNKLLVQALKTGRCHIIENYGDFSAKNFENTPAQNAMASDISIQELMISGTAGVEATLTGTPTLMMDRYGFNYSQFYKLGVGKVVFNNWENLWENLEEHWNNNPIEGFGDWAQIIDDIDPFRDENASARLTKFLYWLTEGFKKGLSKTETLENAVGLYASEWGEDKVFRYNNPRA